jgi:ATP-dependent Clp protease ATP-binding subunit ClpA
MDSIQPTPLVNLPIPYVENKLCDRLLGQPYAIQKLSTLLSEASQTSSIKKIYTMLLCGSPRIGKTFTANLIPHIFSCGDGDPFSYLTFRYNMTFARSENPGMLEYVNYTIVGYLSNAVQRYNRENDGDNPPYLFLIVDEADKAFYNAFKTLASLLSSGSMTCKGDRFALPYTTSLIVIFTSNHGQKTNNVNEPERSIDFIKQEMVESANLDLCDIDRINMIIPFFAGSMEIPQRDRRTKMCVK